uniref:Ribosomal protein L6 n=1 Tax=Toxarium undulatum TaxID=210620 RepID=A0A2U9GIW4_9STRA|nr:ribosomal protein L6 [Toxarium undulatum]AWQ64115.1 ribosomal protein L6 [Toxarium undulatum]
MLGGKRYRVRIPNDICLLYSEQKQLLVFKKGEKCKYLQVPLKIFVMSGTNYIRVSRLTFKPVPNNIKKQLKAKQGLLVALIKQTIFDCLQIRVKKLKLIGLGYKIFHIHDRLVYFKLGHSHSIYFKLPESFKIVSFKSTKLFIFGDCYQRVTQFAALIRLCRKPDSYKGKGVLYLEEKLQLKKGKKI